MKQWVKHLARYFTTNYTRITCLDCKEETIILPGKEFNDLKCKCEKEVKDAKPRRGRNPKTIQSSKDS